MKVNLSRCTHYPWSSICSTRFQGPWWSDWKDNHTPSNTELWDIETSSDSELWTTYQSGVPFLSVTTWTHEYSEKLLISGTSLWDHQRDVITPHQRVSRETCPCCRKIHVPVTGKYMSLLQDNTFPCHHDKNLCVQGTISLFQWCKTLCTGNHFPVTVKCVSRNRSGNLKKCTGKHFHVTLFCQAMLKFMTHRETVSLF